MPAPRISGLLWAWLCLLSLSPSAKASEEDIIDFPGSVTDRYLSNDEIRTQLHGANKGFFACIQGRPVGSPEPGEMTVYFVVDGQGKPQQVRAEVGNQDAILKACMEKVVGSLVFPDHDGDPPEVAYPVVYMRDTQGARTVPYPVVFTRLREPEFLLVPIPPSLTDEQRSLLLRLLWPVEETR